MDCDAPYPGDAAIRCTRPAGHMSGADLTLIGGEWFNPADHVDSTELPAIVSWEEEG